MKHYDPPHCPQCHNHGTILNYITWVCANMQEMQNSSIASQQAINTLSLSLVVASATYSSQHVPKSLQNYNISSTLKPKISCKNVYKYFVCGELLKMVTKWRIPIYIKIYIYVYIVDNISFEGIVHRLCTILVAKLTHLFLAQRNTFNLFNWLQTSPIAQNNNIFIIILFDNINILDVIWTRRVINYKISPLKKHNFGILCCMRVIWLVRTFVLITVYHHINININI